MAESIDWLMRQSHHYPLLTAEQEIILNRHIQAWLPLRHQPTLTRQERAVVRRGKRAYDSFFLSNIRLVVQIAGRYKPIVTNMALEDLVSEGLIGLERAIVKFDSTRGYKFSTYAFNWVRQSINRGISNQERSIRIPVHGTLIIKQAMDFIRSQKIETGIAPTLQETADSLGVSLAQLKLYMQHNASVISLDARLSTDKGDSGNYLDLLTYEAPEPSLLDDPAADALAKAISRLDDRERYILRERYSTAHTDGAPTSYAKIAEVLGCSRERVRQTHDTTMRRLRVQLLSAPAATACTPAQQCAA